VTSTGNLGNRTITIHEGASEGNRTITVQERLGQKPTITISPTPAPGTEPNVTVSQDWTGNQTITVTDGPLGTNRKQLTYQESNGQPTVLSMKGAPPPTLIATMSAMAEMLVAKQKANAAAASSSANGTAASAPATAASGTTAPASSASSTTSASPSSPTASATGAAAGTASGSTSSTTPAATSATGASGTTAAASGSASSSGTAASGTTAASASSGSASTDLQNLMAMSPDQFLQAVQSGKIPDDVANSPSAMAQIQARMNQITQMNQLVTSMMAAMHQMQMSIIQNIRC
jgi:hypothetical protein